MKVLRFCISGTPLFHGDIDVCLVNDDRVRRLSSDNDNVLRAYPLSKISGVYKQVLMGITGINATGKTTLLEVIVAVLSIILENKSLNGPEGRRAFSKLLDDNNAELKMSIWFTDDESLFELQSHVIREGESAATSHFVYGSEVLKKKKMGGLKKATIFDFDNVEPYKTREAFKGDPLLDSDSSIAKLVTNNNCHNTKDIMISLIDITNINIPMWNGHVSKAMLSCFDPAIETLTTDFESNLFKEGVLRFKRSKSTYSADPISLMQHLSSGTIKGLGLLPSIVQVLRRGGYLLIDEIENHFNRKLVEWIFSLFENKELNPHGATLIFTTHYPELLDSFVRKDNIYLMRRNSEYRLELLRFSDVITRTDLQKSNILLSSTIEGITPTYQDICLGTQWIRELVHDNKKEMDHER